MTGKQLTRHTSKSLVHKYSGLTIEATLLFLLGVLAMFLHARFRWGTQIPGHHGIEFMALLTAGRFASRIRLSSIFMAMGIGIMVIMPFMGFKNPVSALGYILPVLFFDLIYSNLPERFRKVWIFAIAGGLSYMAVPLFRIILMLTIGMPYSAALKYGTPLAPLAGFLVFGFIGSFFAAGLSKSIKKKKNEKDS